MTEVEFQERKAISRNIITHLESSLLIKCFIIIFYLVLAGFQQQCQFCDISLSDIQDEYFSFNVLEDIADINLPLRQYQNTPKGHTKKIRHDLSA